MHRKLALAVAGAAVVLAALALFSRSKSGPESGEEVVAESAPADGERSEAGGPAGGGVMRPPEVEMADDPEGTLRLEGQIIDDDDLPVGGATVRVDANPPREAISEADGSFAIDDLVGRTYAVTAVAGDEVGGPVRHELTETSEPVIVRVRPGASVTVIVHDQAGEPIGGADVSVRGSVERSATTGDDGRAEVRGASAGFAVVTAQAEGYGPGREALFIPERAGAETSVTLSLSVGVPIRGRVTAGGDPVAGARVVAEDASATFSLVDPDSEGVLTGDDGRYELPAVSAGNVRVVARHERHPAASSSLIATDGERPVEGVDIELPAAAAVSGRVVTKAGEPVAWASVRVASAEMRGFRSGAVKGATADEDGRFEVEGLEREPAHILATSDGLASDIVSLDFGGLDRLEGVELVLHAPARIAGRVVDGEGEPVPEATVIAFPDVWKGGADAIALRGGDQTTTDGGGNFELANLAEGAYRVRAERGTFRWQGRGPSGVPAQTGDDDVTITLEEDGAIAGRVAFEDGGAPATFTVEVGMGPGTPFAGDDEFELEGVEPGAHTVVIRGPTFSRRTVRGVEVRPGELTDIGTVTVSRGRGVSGHVYDASGAPVAGATVVLGRQLLGDGKSLSGGLGAFADQMGIRSAETDGSGYYEFVGIGDIRQTIAAEHDDRGRSHAAAVPAGAGSASVDLELVPFGSVRGRATVGGEPRRGVSIMATGKSGGDQHVMVTSASDGSFLIERLPAGTHRVTAMLGSGMGSQMAGRDVEVPPGEEAEVDLDIEVGEIELSIEVVSTGDAPLAASQVFLIEGEARAETGADLNQMFRDGEGSMSMGFVLGDKPAAFQQVIPGRYSVCAIPIAGDLGDPEVVRQLQERADELAVDCEDAVVEPSPEAQSVTLEVSPPPPLAPDDDAP